MNIKHITLSLFLAVTSATALAGTETSSFRVNGDIVSVGDSVAQVMTRAGTAKTSYSYDVKRGKTTVSATDYVYEIGNEIYTVTTIQGKVAKIVWDRK